MIQTAGGSKVVLKDFLGGSSGFGRQVEYKLVGKGSGSWDKMLLDGLYLVYVDLFVSSQPSFSHSSFK